MHVWTILCSNNTVDRQSNNISLFNVIEQLKVNVPNSESKKNTKINTIFPSQLVTLWKRSNLKDRSEIKAGVQVSFIGPDGVELQNLKYDIKFPQENRRMRFIVDMKNILLSKTGEYYFVISIKGAGDSGYEEVFRLPLEVHIVSD